MTPDPSSGPTPRNGPASRGGPAPSDDPFALPIVDPPPARTMHSGPAWTAPPPEHAATDPVCGMTVDRRTALSGTRDGTTWWFCCERCRTKFLSPEAHGADRDHGCCGADEPVVPSGEKPYYCPMCPGVESDVPGTCPICGMALEYAGPASSDPAADRELGAMQRRLIVAVALGLPVFLLAMLPMVGLLGPDVIAPRVSLFVQAVLATPVVLGCGGFVFVRGAQSLVARRLNMFTLLALGTGAAYLYSVAALLVPDLFPAAFRHHGTVEPYFEAAATIVVLVLVGPVLELRARRRTQDAIRELTALAPPLACRVRDGKEEVVPLASVVVGDVLRIRPGERVPVDGTVIEGEGTVDESMLTGEPMPVDKEPGAPVWGGTLDGSGTLLMRAARVGRETVLARIVESVAAAQRSRAPIQRLADSVAAWFVPAVVLVSVATFAAWSLWGPVPRLAHALVAAVSVLIIACPCALGLATPMSLVVGLGRAAQAGILIRDAETLERLARIDVLVIDKTGTLTEGRPHLAETIPAAGRDRDGLLALVAAAEHGSAHPLAAAIVRGAEEAGVSRPAATTFASITGQGVEARVEGRTVRVGRPEFVEQGGASGLEAGIAAAAPHLAAGRTVLFAAIDGAYAGCLAVSDRIRATTPAAIESLRRRGVRIVMATGDDERTARHVAAELGLSEHESRMTPDGKRELVDRLKREGLRVAMAGDGVNDAPALAAADVGIALGTGTDAAIASAQVTVLGGDLRGIAEALALGSAVVRNVRQNLGLAFGYNALGIPLAAGVLYPATGRLLNPMWAALAMSLSSVGVVGNALRLRRRGPANRAG